MSAPPRRLHPALLALLLAGAQAEAQVEGRAEEAPVAQTQPQEGRLVLKTAIEAADVKALQEMLDRGVSASCCGNWRDPAAAALQRRVGAELGVPERRLSDVHLANSSMWVRAAAQSSQWSAVAVLYLDSPSDARVGFEKQDGTQVAVLAPEGAVLVAPDGEQLVHEAPRRVAWLRVRREGASDRRAFEFYLAAGIRRNFVAPHDASPDQKFFRAHTRDPTYWHGFFWSFVGMFCTVFACLPLAWWGMQVLEQWMEKPAAAEGTAAAAGPARKAGPPPLQKLSTECMEALQRHRPGTPKLPTLLPLVGARDQRPSSCFAAEKQGLPSHFPAEKLAAGAASPMWA
mmetsp:Transcript_90905/g.266166  ORF Transcript_90905/g.266166 Transcript_90905/m.266166 type:complete len:344 (+) Transcript_90905:79-1110(+)